MDELAVMENYERSRKNGGRRRGGVAEGGAVMQN